MLLGLTVRVLGPTVTEMKTQSLSTYCTLLTHLHYSLYSTYLLKVWVLTVHSLWKKMLRKIWWANFKLWLFKNIKVDSKYKTQLAENEKQFLINLGVTFWWCSFNLRIFFHYLFFFLSQILKFPNFSVMLTQKWCQDIETESGARD